METKLLVSCLLLSGACLVTSQKASADTNRCLKMNTCGACMGGGSSCGWCFDEVYGSMYNARCDLIENLILNGCNGSVIAPPQNVSYLRDQSQRNAESGQEAIQLAPQEMHIKMRPRTPIKFSVSFRQAENYPVDLYYVMDLSNSMEDDKGKLAELGDLLAKEMNKITKNFHLGFGSFVDKKTMPYVSTVPSNLVSPCNGCAAPYGFKNQLSLTDNTSLFKTRVGETQISGNLDGPEGGFDAIMQAVACNNEIGWRDNSRKMLLYSTDASFHYAGDGKLGGIVKPNDGACHLDNAGYYSESLNQDYPSIGQLAHKIIDKKVNVIFAVTEQQVPTYKKLSDFVEGSAVGALADDSSNIVDLVRDNYNKISSTVELKAEADDGVYVTFKTKCNGEELLDGAKCDNVTIGANVSYEVTIEALECPAERDQWKKQVIIYPVGLNEQLVIDIDLTCECECEREEYDDENSPKCNGNGTYECGACSCDEGRFGKTCECDDTNLQSSDRDASCRPVNSTSTEVCSGHGDCICGRCDCHPITPGDPTRRYDLDFCQCNNYNCKFVGGQLCSGPKQGVCKCSKCDCLPGFTGASCDCAISEETCYTEDRVKCNGKGTCICGKCICDKNTYYRGSTCEDCPTCPGKCDENKDCVQCYMFKTGKFSQEYCDANCTGILSVPEVQGDNPDRRLCKFRDEEDSCDFFFTYTYYSHMIEAQKTKECPKPVNKLAIVLGVIAGIILIGLALLLIWKLFVTIHDRREFAKFEKERQNAKWDMGENPIFKAPTSTFKNPTYGGKN